MGDLHRIYEERILDNAADDLLLRAMTESFIHMQITNTALIAQSEFNRMASISAARNEPLPKVISGAKGVVDIFINMKKCLYPNQDNTQINIKAILNSGIITKEQIASLSDEQIREYLGQYNTDIEVK